jgi:hypothetical protein
MARMLQKACAYPEGKLEGSVKMLRRTTIAVVALAVVLFVGAISTPAIADVSFSFFYSNLSPYGTWAVSADYGRVWRPYDYEPGWNPYYDGHWAYTDYGWAWVSDYAWGSVPYHYGTWALDPSLGWIWVPGYVWAPSWVVFSSGPDYVGWAPVPPRFVVGASLGYSTFAPERCVVVPARSFLAPRVRGYALPRSTVSIALSTTRVASNFTVQNHVVVNRGPDPRGIEKASGRTVRPVPIDRVRNVTPTGRFDVAEVRADRHERGGAPLRVTAPEPARPPAPRQQAARPSSPGHEPMRPPAPSRPPETPHAQASPRPSYSSAPPPAAAPRASREPAQSARPSEPGHRTSAPHGQQGSHPSRPTASGNPQKPPQEGKPAQEKHGHGRG